MKKFQDIRNSIATPSNEIILGIDPGTLVTGYGLIRVEQGVMSPLDCGCIKPPASYKLTDRYLVIFEAITELLERYQPSVLSIETQYVNKNVQSAIKLGMARGIAVIAAKRKGLSVFEYAPSKVKSAVVGRGQGSKAQVQAMVMALLKLSALPKEDAADALALAICHAHSMRFRELMLSEI
jgi:crossover junction endodeoxyribonuclease RuvC